MSVMGSDLLSSDVAESGLLEKHNMNAKGQSFKENGRLFVEATDIALPDSEAIGGRPWTRPMTMRARVGFDTLFGKVDLRSCAPGHLFGCSS